MGIDAFRLPKQKILFAAFRGWDAVGAKSFGYETYWANRLNLPVEELGVKPDQRVAKYLPKKSRKLISQITQEISLASSDYPT